MIRAAFVPLAATLAVLGCFVLSTSADGDPLLGVEAAGIVVVMAWAGVVAWHVGRTVLLRRTLWRDSSPAELAGVRFRVLRTSLPIAMAVGVLRPTVFVSEAALSILDEQEALGVLLHEDHHRRTLAPLRSSGLIAWVRLVGRSPTVRAWLDARLAAIETAADRHALRHGATPSSLAAALLKLDTAGLGSSFAGHEERRVLALLDAADGSVRGDPAPLPLEWLPLVGVVAMAVGCRLSGVVTPF